MLLKEPIQGASLPTVKSHRLLIGKINVKLRGVGSWASAHGGVDRIIITTKSLGAKLSIESLTSADGGVAILDG